MLAAVDLGYAQVKARSGQRQIIFSSVVGNPSVFELNDEYSRLHPENDRMVVTYNGKTYAVGNGALRHTNNARLCGTPTMPG